MNPEALFEALDDAGVDYVIVGGLAGAVRGATRVTKDIDIAYAPTPGNCRRLADVLNAIRPRRVLLGVPEGEPIVLDGERLRKERVLQLDTSAGRIDMLDTIAGFSNYNAVRAASSPVPIHGRVRNVLTRAGLIKAKQALRRPKDEADLLELKALEELEQA